MGPSAKTRRRQGKIIVTPSSPGPFSQEEKGCDGSDNPLINFFFASLCVGGEFPGTNPGPATSVGHTLPAWSGQLPALVLDLVLIRARIETHNIVVDSVPDQAIGILCSCLFDQIRPVKLDAPHINMEDLGDLSA